jgi:hypothetical protein
MVTPLVELGVVLHLDLHRRPPLLQLAYIRKEAVMAAEFAQILLDSFRTRGLVIVVLGGPAALSDYMLVSPSSILWVARSRAIFFVMLVSGDFESIDDLVEAALSLRRHHLVVSEEGGRSMMQGVGVGEGGLGGDQLMDVSRDGLAYGSKLMAHSLPSNNNRIKQSIKLGNAKMAFFSYYSS